MATSFDIFSDYLGTPSPNASKANEVIAASARKKAELTDDQIYRNKVGQYNNAGQLTSNPIERDLRNLDPLTFQLKYGDEAPGLMARDYQASQTYRNDSIQDRDAAQIIGDTANSVAMGAANSLLGIGSFGLGLVDDSAGARSATAIGRLNSKARSLQSNELNAARRADSALSSQQSRDTSALFEKDKKSSGSFIASIKRIGRDTVNAATRTMSNGAIAGDTIASGVGSLLAAGPLGKGLSAATGLARTTVMPAAIGMMEGGGAYQQTAEAVMSMSHEDLLETSPEYRELIAQDPNDPGIQQAAKERLANAAAIKAGAIQTGVGAVTGTLVSKFEANPLAVPSLKAAGKNIINETVEEGIQSGSGQAAQNFGIQSDVNPNLSLSDGVGEQIALGAIGGMGAAGSVQAPGAAIRAPLEGTRFIGRTALAGAKAVGQPVFDALVARGEKIAAAGRDKAQAVYDTARDAVVNGAPAAAEMIKSRIQSMKGPAEEKKAATDYVQNIIDKMGSAAHLDRDDLAPEIRSVLTGSRFDAVDNLARLAQEAESDETKTQAALLVHELAQDNAALLDRDTPEALKHLNKDEEASQALDALERFSTNMLANPRVANVLAPFKKKLEEEVKTDISSPFSLGSVQGKLAVAATLHQAERRPDSINVSVAENILKHADDGHLDLTPAQAGALKASLALIKASHQMTAEAKRVGIKPVDIVSGQVLSGKQTASQLGRSGGQYVKDITASYRAGDLDGATNIGRELMLFAQHMQNKVAALNGSLAGRNVNPGGKVAYEALNSRTRQWYTDSVGLGLNPYAERSIDFAQKTGFDAAAIVAIANGISAAFPELKLGHVKPIILDASITEDTAKQVERKYREAKKVVPTNETSSEVNTDQPTDMAPEQVATEDVKPVQSEAEVNEPASETKVVSEPAAQSEPTPVQETVAPRDEQQATGLIGGAANRFVQAFRKPNSPKTRIQGDINPLVSVTQAFGSQEKYNRFLGSTSKKPLTDEMAATYQSYLEKGEQIVAVMEKSLAKFLSVNGNGDKLLKGDFRPLAYPNGKAANLVMQTEDGLHYNPELIETAVLAGLQWLINGMDSQPTPDADTVADITGLSKEAVQSAGLVDAFKEGMTTVPAKRSLAQKILSYWGMDVNRTAAVGSIEGIAEAVAAEMIDAMIKTGAVEKTQITIGSVGNIARVLDKDESKKSFLADNEGAKVKDYDLYNPKIDNEDLNAFPSAIEELVMVEPEDITFIGEPPKQLMTAQLRNPNAKLTPQQMSTLRNEQNIPHYANSPMINLYRAMGIDNVLALFGAGNLEGRDKFANAQHFRSLEGKNRTITSAFKSIMSLSSQLERVADGSSIDTLPVYYRYAFTKVNRLMMLGRDNPQANKLMREAILPTKTTVDLTNQDNEDLYFLALAQALGIKVHKQSKALSIAQVRTLLNNDLAPLVQMVKQPNFSEADISQMKELLAKDLSPWALHAIVDYARYNDTVDRSAFDTSVYLEADGVTNGPINAMVLLTPGEFHPIWVKNIAKGGLWFGRGQFTMNEHHGEDNVDLYQNASEILTRLFGQQNVNTPEGKLFKHLAEVMQLTFGGDIKLVEDGDNITIEAKRGVTKNPLTITIYGSGAEGIASNLVDQITSRFYEMISDANEAKAKDPKADIGQIMFPGSMDADAKWAQLKEGMDALISFKIGEKGVERTGNRLNFSDPAKFKLGLWQLKALQDNMLKLFVTPLREAIEQTVGTRLAGAEGTANLLRKAIQVQGIFLQHEFQKRYQQRLAAKEETDSWKKTDGLSQAEVDQIHKELEAYSPMIDTSTQRFYVAGSQKADVGNLKFGRGFKDEMDTDGFVHGPRDPGVAGIAFINIGTGDGQMIQSLFTDPKTPKKRLGVYDGVHFSIDSINAGSLAANKAVFDSWINNPLHHIANSFDLFIGNASFEEMPDAMRKQLARALFDDKEGMIDPELARIEMEHILKTLKDHALSIEARHNVMKRVGLTVDQMASAGQPYVNQGEYQLQSKTPEDQAKELNALYQEELAKLEAKPIENQEIPEVLNSVGRIDDNGVQTISHNQLRRLVQKMKPMAEQKKLLTEIVKSLLTKEYTIKVGTASALGIDATNVHGQINLDKREISLVNPSEETLLHELIHAATIDKLTAFYDGQALSAEEQDAIKRIEGLMDQFMNEYDPTGLTGPLREAVSNARGAIMEHQLNNNPAAAVNEFMAWGLSNADLIEALKTTKANPLVRIAKEVVQYLKQLIWGRRQMPKVGEDIYSNLRFNTSVLIQTQPTVAQQYGATMLYRSEAFGNSERLSEVRRAFHQTVVSWIHKAPVEKQEPLRRDKVNAIVSANVLAEQAVRVGFTKDMQSMMTFRAIVAAMATEADINPNALARVQDLYTHVVKNMTVEKLMEDPESQDPNARYEAQAKFNMLTGVLGTQSDIKDRSSLLPVFLGLAIVDDQFRKTLADMEVPKSLKLPNTTMDAVLTNAGSSMMESLSRTMSGEGKSADVQQAIDALAAKIIETAQEEKSFIDRHLLAPAGNAFDNMNQMVVDGVSALSGTIVDKSKSVLEDPEAHIISKGVAHVGTMVAAVLSEQHGANAAEGIISMLNRTRGFQPIFDMVKDLVGRTESNAAIYDMIKQVRSVAQAIRQQFRENLPGILEKQFSRPLTETEQTALYKIAQIDMAVFKKDQALKLMADPSMAQSEVYKLEDQIRSMDPRYADSLFAKSQQLADYLVTGAYGSNLLRNAEAIAQLFNENALNRPTPIPALVRAIDQLVSLYAFDKLDETTKESLSSLVQGEAKGVGFSFDYLIGQRVDEGRKSQGMAKYNAYKGFIPTEQKSNAHLVLVDIADTENVTRLENMGYKQIGDYQGSNLDRYASNMRYYFAPVSGRAVYNQGIMQNIQHTAGGVLMQTGFTNGLTAGRITEPQMVDKIRKQLAKEKASDEGLLPVFNEKGDVVAFERAVSPEKLAMLGKSTQFTKMMGVWAGRQVEERVSQKLNETLIDRLAEMYQTEKGTKAAEYINLFESKDPVMADGIKLLTPETRAYIAERFGTGFFVRRDLAEDVLGYRQASVGDLWTGNSRWDPAFVAQLQKAAMGVFGKEAYRYLVNGERLVQNVITDARIAIVIKSVIVPAANLISNGYQLAARGVPLKDILTGMPRKVVEIDRYVKSRVRLLEAEAELRASVEDIVMSRKLKAEIQSIKDGHKRLSFWPLIEAGEFTSISDAGVTSDDILLSEGRIHEYMEKLVGRLPKSIQTAGRYAIISRDTALFQGLQRAVEYGDFIGKAILYDDLTKRQGKDQAYALGRISEEFVNYDRLPGRFRGYLESVGLLWFWNFKVRSAKIALSMIRNNPLHALLVGNIPAPEWFGSVGLPITDNIFAVMADGRIHYSIGVDQAFRAHALNPWLNLTS